MSKSRPATAKRRTAAAATEPLYRLIERSIREDIAGGRFRPGAQIWSERKFREHFDVSGNTVRKALDLLVHEGLLFRRQGKGTYVRGGVSSRACVGIVLGLDGELVQ